MSGWSTTLRGRRLVVVISILCWIGIASVRSQDFSAVGLRLESTSETVEGIEYVVSDEAGNRFSVVSAEEITDRQIGDVARYRTRFLAFRGLTIASFTVVFFENETEITIVPAVIEYRGENLARHIPSGISFFDVGRIEYGFRLRVGNRFPRISGRLTTEEALYDAILAAVAAPEPEEDTARASASEAQGMPDPLVSAEEFAELRARVVALEETVVSLQRDLSRLRRAILVLNNTGIFGNINPVPEEGIRRVVELKEDNPDLLQEEAADMLKREGITMSTHEIFLVFSLYFNEFR